VYNFFLEKLIITELANKSYALMDSAELSGGQLPGTPTYKGHWNITKINRKYGYLKNIGLKGRPIISLPGELTFPGSPCLWNPEVYYRVHVSMSFPSPNQSTAVYYISQQSILISCFYLGLFL
jgi:hypothetical protein